MISKKTIRIIWLSLSVLFVVRPEPALLGDDIKKQSKDQAFIEFTSDFAAPVEFARPSNQSDVTEPKSTPRRGLEGFKQLQDLVKAGDVPGALQQIGRDLEEIDRQLQVAKTDFDEKIRALADLDLADSDLLQAYQDVVAAYDAEKSRLEELGEALKKEQKEQLANQTREPTPSTAIATAPRTAATTGQPFQDPQADSRAVASPGGSRAAGPTGSGNGGFRTGGGGPRVRPTPLITPKRSKGVDEAEEIAQRDPAVSAADRRALQDRAQQLRKQLAADEENTGVAAQDDANVEASESANDDLDMDAASPIELTEDAADSELERYRQQLRESGIDEPQDLEKLSDEWLRNRQGAREAQREALDALAESMDARAFTMLAGGLPPLKSGSVFEFEITGRARLEETKSTPGAETKLNANHRKLSVKWTMSSMTLPQMKLLLQGLQGVHALQYQVNRALADPALSAVDADPIRISYFQNARITLAAMRQVIDGSLLIYQNESKPTVTSFDGSQVSWKKTFAPSSKNIPPKTVEIDMQGSSPNEGRLGKHAGRITLLQISSSLIDQVKRGLGEMSAPQFDLSAEDRMIVEKLGSMGDRFLMTLESVAGPEGVSAIERGAAGWCQLEITPNSLNYFPVHWLGTRTEMGGDQPEPSLKSIDEQTTLDRLIGNMSLGTGPIEPAFELIGHDGLELGSGGETRFKNSLIGLIASGNVDPVRTRSGLSVSQVWTRAQHGNVELIFAGDAKGKQWNHEYVFTWKLSPQTTTGFAMLGAQQGLGEQSTLQDDKSR